MVAKSLSEQAEKVPQWTKSYELALIPESGCKEVLYQLACGVRLLLRVVVR